MFVRPLTCIFSESDSQVVNKTIKPTIGKAWQSVTNGKLNEYYPYQEIKFIY